ncbi:MAG: RimK family alpha-L-glutamate ligase [Bacteroidetes bacterium HGW-Bacteroidetes-17]|jgi:glutathione synthase/RimK-type ligase-like ATP-grasp enzyme/ribosomal protein S18 acetylase RimI-like enzyme|nr:MAG: RimK family alpha-L-glutamate ligase [Bacteroidetes bacterium HGW-Bacteroidetes-17]
MTVILRRSEISDLDLLDNIEKNCFKDFQQSSRRNLNHSLTSPFQEVWIAEKKNGNGNTVVGALILHLRSHTLRIYSLAVLPAFQGKGIGQKLLTHATNIALAKGCVKVSLEAHSKDDRLVGWYKRFGFRPKNIQKDYYAKDEHAVRMIFTLSRPKVRSTISNLIVVDRTSGWKLKLDGVRIVSSKSYIADPEFQTNLNLRVFNLSNSYRYQSLGYYVSLLASARDHRAIPSVTTMRDFKNLSVIRSIANDIDELIQAALARVNEKEFSLKIYFGQTTESAFKILGYKLYQLFESPILEVSFVKTDKWLIKKIAPLSLEKIIDVEQDQIQSFANTYFSKKRFQKPRLKHFKYDLAILINPNEPNPPSCPLALKSFKEAANKIGFYVDFITKDDYHDICEYDALFIRETTSVNDHTYQFSRRAYAEGLVVIDDPWSILRCANKVYLNERMKQNKIATPRTEMLTKGVFNLANAELFTFPLVLKQPDSAFSLGVTKVTNAAEMVESVQKLFQKSDLIIAQEFLYSEFDWRIGILDQLPLFACKYFMAKDHWQIYNWKASKDEGSGEAETIPISMVPENVLKVALKAAALMGDGLYGVDLKEVGDKVYVIEVNDNPNIDADIEDFVLKDELYTKVMQTIFNRIEDSRNTKRLVAVELT